MALYETEFRKQCSKCKKIKDKTPFNFELKGHKYSRSCLECKPSKKVEIFKGPKIHWLARWEKTKEEEA